MIHFLIKIEGLIERAYPAGCRGIDCHECDLEQGGEICTILISQSVKNVVSQL